MQKIKLNTTKTFLLGLALIVAAGLVLRLITPKTKQTWQTENQTSLTQQNPDGSHSLIEKVTYTGEELLLPETLPLVTVENNPSFNGLEKIIAALNLGNDDETPDFWINQGWSLVYDTPNNLFILSSNNKPSLEKSIQKTAAVQAGFEWLKKLNLPINLVVDESNIKYLEGQYELRAVAPGLASFIQIPFGYTIESYPLLTAQDSNAPYVMTLDSDYQLQKLAVRQTEVVKTQNIALKKTVTIEQAVQNIRQKSTVSIIGLSKTPAEYSLDNIDEAVLSKAEIEYRIELDGKTAAPYYKFTGQITFADQKTAEAIMITPALEL